MQLDESIRFIGRMLALRRRQGQPPRRRGHGACCQSQRARRLAHEGVPILMLPLPHSFGGSHETHDSSASQPPLRRHHTCLHSGRASSCAAAAAAAGCTRRDHRHRIAHSAPDGFHDGRARHGRHARRSRSRSNRAQRSRISSISCRSSSRRRAPSAAAVRCSAAPVAASSICARWDRNARSCCSTAHASRRPIATAASTSTTFRRRCYRKSRSSRAARRPHTAPMRSRV